MQLATIVQEFFVTNSILDPSTEERFQQFLSQKATRYKQRTLLQHALFCAKLIYIACSLLSKVPIM